MKKLAVVLIALFLTKITLAQDFSRFQSFEENSKGKNIIELEPGEWKLEDHISDINFHVRTFSYSKDSTNEKVSIEATQHNRFKLAGDMVDHVGTVILDKEMITYKGQHHLFLYRKGTMKDEVYAIVWLKADGTELYFKVGG